MEQRHDSSDGRAADSGAGSVGSRHTLGGFFFQLNNCWRISESAFRAPFSFEKVIAGNHWNLFENRDLELADIRQLGLCIFDVDFRFTSK